MEHDYAKDLHVKATTTAVYAALTTLAGCSSWWAPASGSALAGGELRFTFDDPAAPLVLRVAEAEPAAREYWIDWGVTDCPFLPDWAGTTLAFRFSPAADGGTGLRFEHAGLSPRLDCFDQCQAGWDYYLPSLRAYAESGTGSPFARRPS
jgi:uncharacterized protein YndB with AHSA1/START domain